jgi:hypothetical protein
VDLLSLLRIAWRFKFATLAVMMGTLALGVAVVVVSPPVFTAVSSYLLIEPPEPPSPAEIEADPQLGRIKSDNPFSRYADPSVIVNVVSRQVSSEQVRKATVDAGGDDEYEVAPSRRFGSPSPIVDITATGSSEQAVFTTLDFVGKQLTSQLRAVQADEDVDPTYMFTARLVEYPQSAKRVVSGTLRVLIGVAAFGGLTLILVLALLHNRARMRDQTPTRRSSTPESD